MNSTSTTAYPQLLSGVKVLDLSHLYAGLLASSLLGDLGADVTVVEHPSRTMIRTMLPKREGESMWWKVTGRGKRAVSLDLSTPEGRELCLALAKEADVVVENFRPGTLERWGLGPKDFEEAGASFVMLRVSGFGQTGPMRNQPGFGTAGEAMSGFANLTGEPEKPPTFSSTTLADGVSAVFGAFGLMAALASRARGTAGPAIEVVDVALFEGLFRIIPTQVSGYDQVGYVPHRPGNSLIPHGTLRNLYVTADGKYFIVAAIGVVTVKRILEAIAAPDLVEQVDQGVLTSESDAVMAFLYECDARLASWAKSLPYDEVARRLAESDVVYQPIFTVEDIVKDPQYAAREDLVRVPDEDFGDILMQGIVPKFPSREHRIEHAGRARGRDNHAVFGALGVTPENLKDLRDRGVV
ncbi:CaiB/BaiF CoA-transferase family protein [Diaminobutyricimonas sp. TR449]|uniref:CaiB/BaiF CoA transferase family protein n=1 Tax=Diaminobutyricimonas sp. TR449 TaxID=2708076 RepID=UPI0014218463|nr:CaiB/BaiF CoA-transferase family protein [Diaminobutyricimonas sp. TR449]